MYGVLKKIALGVIFAFGLVGCETYVPKNTFGTNGPGNNNDDNNNGQFVKSTFNTETGNCDGNASQLPNFNVLWKTLEKEYAVFDLRLPVGRTWQQIGIEGCEKIEEDTSDFELYGILIAMVKEMNDGHTYIEAESIGRDDDTWDGYEFEAIIDDVESNVEDNYIDGAEFQVLGIDDDVSYGTIGNNVGYIGITYLEGLTAADDFDEDVAFANSAMNTILPTLANTTGLIIDLRASYGGYDEVGIEFAKYIAGPQSVAWRKQSRNGPNYTDLSPLEEFMVPAGTPNAYQGPVVVLTSGDTFSASETMVMALKSRPNVTVLGVPTSGHLSDIYDLDLPNGWYVAYSGERYYDPQGQIHEGKGIPVDVSVPIDANFQAQFANGVDLQIQAAVDMLQ